MNNSLMIKKDNIFIRIRNFFKKIFKKDKEIILMQTNTEDINNYKQEKQDILQTYNKLIKGEILEKDIPKGYKEKIKELLKEEVKIHEKVLEDINTECGMIKFKIESYENMIKNAN